MRFATWRTPISDSLSQPICFTHREFSDQPERVVPAHSYAPFRGERDEASELALKSVERVFFVSKDSKANGVDVRTD